MSDLRDMLDGLAKASSPEEVRAMIDGILGDSDLPLSDLTVALGVLDSVERNCSRIATSAELERRHDDALRAVHLLGEIAGDVLRAIHKPRPKPGDSTGRAFAIHVVVQPEGFVSDWSVVADDGGEIATNGFGRDLAGTLALCSTLIAEHMSGTSDGGA